jgi:branched-chain amino acid transport system permease protein
MTGRDRTPLVLTAGLVALVAVAPFLPSWAVFLVTVSLAKGLVALGLLLLMRAGLVSFGQGLYYALGAYAGGVAAARHGVGEGLAIVALGAAAGALAAGVLGLLVARYRTIFFAMLTLAFSMIFYGLLVKTQALGSTDGFNVHPSTLAGLSLEGPRGKVAVLVLAALLAWGSALGLNAMLRAHVGRLAPAIKDNELRVEYMGASVQRTVHLYLVVSSALAGLGGGLAALTVGHIDPEMAYWTTSGEFVFITIFAGTGSVAAPFLGAVALELLRSFAYEHSPNTWQMVVGGAMLAVILFLPGGLWSLFRRREAA